MKSDKCLRLLTRGHVSYVLLTGLFWSFAVVGYAQVTTTYESMYWLRYYNQWTISQKWVWHNEVDNRRLFNNSIQNQVIAHSHLHYRAGAWEPAIGMTFSWQHAYNPVSAHTLTVPEVRPFQEINHRTKLSRKASLQQRLRLDERFVHNTESGEITTGYTFSFRPRYRIQLNYQISEKIMLKANDELFVYLRKQWFEQNRIYTGIEYSCTKKLGIELGYMHLYQQRKADAFVMRHIGRLTLHHRLGQ